MSRVGSAKAHSRLVCSSFKDPMRLQEGPIPKPADGEIIVQTAFAGICHTDIHLWKNDMPYFCEKLPNVYGHEISGTVHSIGPKVNIKHGLSVGDRVAIYPWAGCQSCSVCDVDPHHCPNLGKPGVNIHIFGFFRDGGYQNFVRVSHARLLHKIPDSVPMDLAALIPCSGITAYNSVATIKNSIDTAIKLQGEARVLIVGMGGLGMWALRILRGLYPNKLKVFSTATRAEKVEIVKKENVDGVVLWDRGTAEEALVKRTQEVCGGPINGVIDFVCYPETVQRAIAVTGVAATVATAGVMGDQPLSLNLAAFTLTAKRLEGIVTGSPAQMDQLINLVKLKKVAPVPIKYVHLKDVNQCFKDLEDGKVTGRLVIKF